MKGNTFDWIELVDKNSLAIKYDLYLTWMKWKTNTERIYGQFKNDKI